MKDIDPGGRAMMPRWSAGRSVSDGQSKISHRNTLVAFGLALLATALPTVGPPPASGAVDPAAVHAEIVQELGQAQISVQKCAAFFERFGDRPAVASALQRIETRPGRTLFTSPETIKELEGIAGEPIHLGHRDLELCVQVRDRSVGPGLGSGKPA